METQMQHHQYGGDTHGTGAGIEGENADHHEKKSVIKKVKAKAKKIKDKLTPHGHGHHDQHEHDHEEEDDDDTDEDDEMVQDPEIHGAPIYESAAVRSGVTGQGGNYFERPSVKEDKHHEDSHIYDPPVRPFKQWQEENSGLDRPTLTHAPADKSVSYDTNISPPPSNVAGIGRNLKSDQTKDVIGELPPIEEDPHAPKHHPYTAAPSNYESKVTDPTSGGGNEAGITSVLHSLDKMKIYDEKPKTREETKTVMDTGSHDQFSPEPVPKSFNPDKPEEMPRDTPVFNAGNQANQSSYREQISSATSAIAGKAVAAKDAIASKLGYTGSDESKTGFGDNTKSASPSVYANKIAATVTEKLAPVYEKVADAGSTVISKVQASTGTVGTGKQEEKGPDKGVSVTTYLTERLRPGDEDKALSEAITHAFKRNNEGKAKEKEVQSGDQGKPISERIMDALHKRGTEAEYTGEGDLGRVTESEEVKRRLGTGEEKKENSGGNSSYLSTQKGVVDRLTGAFSSWMGKGAESQSTGTTYVTDEGLSSSAGGQDEGGHKTGERASQESTY